MALASHQHPPHSPPHCSTSPPALAISTQNSSVTTYYLFHSHPHYSAITDPHVPRALQPHHAMCAPTSTPLPNQLKLAAVPMRRSYASMGVARPPSMVRTSPPLAPSMARAAPMSAESMVPMGGYAMQRSSSSYGVDGNPYAARAARSAPASKRAPRAALAPLPLSPLALAPLDIDAIEAIEAIEALDALDALDALETREPRPANLAQRTRVPVSGGLVDRVPVGPNSGSIPDTASSTKADRQRLHRARDAPPRACRVGSSDYRALG